MSIKKKDWSSPKKKEFCIQTALRLKATASDTVGIPSLLDFHENFELASLYNCEGRFLEINSIYCVCVCVCVCVSVSCSVVTDSLSMGATRLLCPWDSPGGNSGVGCHALLQGIFLSVYILFILLLWETLTDRGSHVCDEKSIINLIQI